MGSKDKRPPIELSETRAVEIASFIARQLEVRGSVGCAPDDLVVLAWSVLRDRRQDQHQLQRAILDDKRTFVWDERVYSKLPDGRIKVEVVR